ncbi:LysM peptidoglycan-binding domain-containing protein [Virgibacillus soli]|uniref:3D domain-containing protein n=1 Tax=Paracerasibacillus soli TaxID=480284 RepID=UPI0035EF3B29
MKKALLTLAIGLVIAGTTTTTVFADEHVVKKGDNLWDIANTHDVTVDYLMEKNELESSIIYPEQKLSVQETYKVKKGDTLYRIAKDNNVSVKELKEWNNLQSNLIVIGEELMIKAGSIAIENEQSQPVMASKQQKNKEKSSQTTASPAMKKSETPEGKTLTVTATAYTADCAGCSGITKTGIDLRNDRNAKVIAVDPNVVPLGSKVYVEGYGYAIAGDTGGAIKGNKIDIHVPTKKEAYAWGVRTVKLTIVE